MLVICDLRYVILLSGMDWVDGGGCIIFWFCYKYFGGVLGVVVIKWLVGVGR